MFAKCYTCQVLLLAQSLLQRCSEAWLQVSAIGDLCRLSTGDFICLHWHGQWAMVNKNATEYIEVHAGFNDHYQRLAATSPAAGVWIAICSGVDFDVLCLTMSTRP